VLAFGLEVGGFLGVLLSAGFVYFEIGRFAAPQVPTSRFDESKAITAYAVGLFIGVPLALVWIFLQVAVADGAWVSALVDLVLLVTGAELAQTVLLRTHFFGFTPADPFYALAARAGIAGLLTVATVAEYLTGAVSPLGLVLVGAQSVALLLIQVTAGLRALLPTPTASSVVRQRLASFVLVMALYVLTGSGWFYGELYGLAGTALALGGAGFLYWDARPTVLAPRRPARPASEGSAGADRSRFARRPTKGSKPKSR
jgi:hypothetical protein